MFKVGSIVGFVHGGKIITAVVKGHEPNSTYMRIKTDISYGPEHVDRNDCYLVSDIRSPYECGQEVWFVLNNRLVRGIVTESTYCWVKHEFKHKIGVNMSYTEKYTWELSPKGLV